MREASTNPLRAAIYVRISKDRAGAGLGVERQEQDCRDLAARLGWKVVEVYADNDISAHSGAHRPQYEAMLRAVEEGRIGGILAWHTDRLHRRTMELETFVSLAEAHGTQVQTVSAGEVDLSTASGRMVARMLGAAAQHEVDHARERMRRAKQQAAETGKYRGGRRPYGFESDGVTLRPSEASVIEETTAAVLAGRSLASLTRELNEAGHVTSSGKPWTRVRLREVLVRPRNAGLISKGRPGGSKQKPFAVVGRASWPAIVDEDTWRAVYSMLTDPSRSSSYTGNDPRWLGSGVFVCGRSGCGAKMRAATAATPNGRVNYYRCTERSHLTVLADKSDDFVRLQVAALVRDPRIVAALRGGDAAAAADRERRTVLVARLEAFEADYAAGEITGKVLSKATAAVTAEIADIDERMSAGLQRTAASDVLDSPDPGAAFLSAPVDVQRAVLRTVCTVTVLPASRRGQAWTSERLDIGPVAALGPQEEAEERAGHGERETR